LEHFTNDNKIPNNMLFQNKAKLSKKRH